MPLARSLGVVTSAIIFLYVLISLLTNQEALLTLVRRLNPLGEEVTDLYLAEGQKTIWAYLSVYEYDMGLIKAGLPVEITAIAFPGEVFTGRIAAISPVLDPTTRSIQARTEIGNPGGKLKPGMFVNA